MPRRGTGQGSGNYCPAPGTGEVPLAADGRLLLYSDIRDFQAIALDVLLDVDPRNPQVGTMARHVSEQLTRRSWYSTQECAFGFLAMGKLARATAQSTSTAIVTVGGRRVGVMDGTPAKWSAADLRSTQVDVDVRVEQGDSLYYWWQAEGISSTGAYRKEETVTSAPGGSSSTGLDTRSAGTRSTRTTS